MTNSLWVIIAQHSDTEYIYKEKIYRSLKMAELWAEKHQKKEYNPRIRLVVREYRAVEV